MKNVYDVAHELVDSLKESDQYKDAVAAKKYIDANPQLQAMVEDFKQKSAELSVKQMSGELTQEAAMAQVQQLFMAMGSDPAVMDYLQKDAMLANIVNDVTQIIFEALKF